MGPATHNRTVDIQGGVIAQINLCSSDLVAQGGYGGVKERTAKPTR